MLTLMKDGYRAKQRPSGHRIGKHFARNNGASIPPNLIAIANAESNSYYLRYCREKGLDPHPARYPAALPEYFIRMLTDEGDFVFDPFAGSCVTGEVCERLRRKWACCDIVESYLQGALARFDHQPTYPNQKNIFYRIAHPSTLWDGVPTDKLPADGGQKRPKRISSKP